jgi:lysophospholipase L1-like esterase
VVAGPSAPRGARCSVFRLVLLALIALVTLAPAADAQRRYLALGDSYTIGEGVPEAERWPVQLAAALTAAGVRVAAPEIIARTGWTTDELDAAITARDPKGPYALVTLLIGVNNQYRGRNVDEYRTQFRALLTRAIGFAGGEASRVIVVSIPDWGVTPFNTRRDKATVAAQIDAYNAVNKDEAAAASVAWLDITDLTRAQPAAVVADGLHPSAAMYAQWTARLLPLARAALAR